MKIENIKKIGVFGGGTMGPGIAIAFAKGGYDVCLWSRRKERIEQARKMVHSSLEVMIAHELVSPSDSNLIEGRIAYTDSLADAARDADFIMETIVEDKGAKKSFFEEMDGLSKAGAIWASNTSSLNVYDLIPEKRLPNSIIAHWFAPPNIIPLVEVVLGEKTGEEIVTATIDILQKVGKVPVRVNKFIAGFLINRILRILGREAFFLMDNGYVTADQLDLAVKASIAPRMMLLGLIQRYDFTGLEISAKNLQNKDFPDPPIDNEPKSLFDLVKQGHLGVKTGKGFFDYSGRTLAEINQERDDLLIRILKSTEFCLDTTVGVTPKKS